MSAKLHVHVLSLALTLAACSSGSSSNNDGGTDTSTDGGLSDGGSDCQPGDECYAVGGDNSPCGANEENCFTFTSPSGATFHSRCTRNLIGWHFEGAQYNPKELYYFCKQEMPQSAGTEYQYYTFKIYFPAPTVGAYSSTQVKTSIFDGAAVALDGFDASHLELVLDDANVTAPVFDVTLDAWDATSRAYQFTADIELSDGTNTVKVKGIGKGTADPK